MKETEIKPADCTAIREINTPAEDWPKPGKELDDFNAWQQEIERRIDEAIMIDRFGDSISETYSYLGRLRR